VHEVLGGDTAGTADPNSPKGYPITYDIVLSNKSWRRKEEVRDFWSDGVCVPGSPYGFPGDGWTPAC